MLVVLLLLLLPSVPVLVRRGLGAFLPLGLVAVAFWGLLVWIWMPNLASPYGWLGYAWALVFGGIIGLGGTLRGSVGPVARILPDPWTVRVAASAAGLGLLTVVVTLVGPGWLFPLTSIRQVAASGQIHVSTSALPPINVAQLNVVPPATAYQAMANAVGSYGAQYQVSPNQVYEVRIGGQQVYVAPLIWNTWFVWLQTGGRSPGYIEISATNPNAAPTFVAKSFRYEITGVPLYSGSNVRRHIWSAGYRRWVLSTSWDSFEIAPNGTPYWVVSGAVPTDGMAGLRITAVLLLNAETGAITRLPLGTAIPSWINEAVPPQVATDWTQWYGRYRNGWFAASPWGSHIGIYQPVYLSNGAATFGVMGPGGDLYWYTGLTSNANADNSLVGYVMVDARTGASTFYPEGPGMMNGAAAIQKVDGTFPNNQLVGAMPLFADLYGKEVFVVPVVNGSNKLQDFAIVDPRAPNAPALTAGSWTDALGALQQYLASGLAGTSGASSSVQEITVSGQIGRIGMESPGTIAFTITGHSLVFSASAASFPTAALAQAGDSVTVTYVLTPGTTQPVIPVSSFSDPTILGSNASSA